MHYSCILNNWNTFFLWYFNCVVQDSLYHNMYIGTMWHCALVSRTRSQSIGLVLGCVLFWCWVSLCVPFTNPLIECYFFMMIATIIWIFFMAILLIVIYTSGLSVTRWFCRYAFYWMFLSLDILFEYWIEHVTFWLLYVMFRFSTRIFYWGVPCFATDCLCGVWCHGKTTLVHVLET